jgi:hypothetical protein
VRIAARGVRRSSVALVAAVGPSWWPAPSRRRAAPGPNRIGHARAWAGSFDGATRNDARARRGTTWPRRYCSWRWRLSRRRVLGGGGRSGAGARERVEIGASGSTRGGEEAREWGRPDDAGGELPARRGAAAPAELNRERIRSGRGEPKLALGFRGGIFVPSDGSSENGPPGPLGAIDVFQPLDFLLRVPFLLARKVVSRLYRFPLVSVRAKILVTYAP